MPVTGDPGQHPVATWVKRAGTIAALQTTRK
jgi:hypothetical protein